MIYACLAGHAGPGDGAGGRAALKRSKPLEYPNALVETQGHAAELEGKLNKREAEVERLRSALHEAGVDTQTLMGSDPVRHPALPILEFRVYLVWGFAEANTDAQTLGLGSKSLQYRRNLPSPTEHLALLG